MYKQKDNLDCSVAAPDKHLKMKLVLYMKLQQIIGNKLH